MGYFGFMKLMVVHLSDMHFRDSDNVSAGRVNAIVGTLQPQIKGIDAVLVIVSGDLAFSGDKQQFAEVKCFLDSFKKIIKSRYGIGRIDIVVVPGNHDVDYEKGSLDGKFLDDIEKDNLYDDFLNIEIDKQSEFFSLANVYDCFSESKFVHKKVLRYGNRALQINLINTAFFSSLSEDQGFHYIPIKYIHVLSEQGNSDYVFSVMHHPHHWYSYRVKKSLEEMLYSRSDIIFVGHEHYEASMQIESKDNSVNIFAGGQLCNQGDWSNSEFHVGVLDLDSRYYSSKRYKWTGRIYEEQGDEKRVLLSKNRFNLLNLSIRQEFTDSLNEDKYFIANTVKDYFVFPLLVTEQNADDHDGYPKEINSMPEFLRAVIEHKKIIISGANDSGKTLLAKTIFSELSSSKVVLFVSGSDIANINYNKYDRVIRDAFEDIYSTDSSDYEAFRQTNPENLAIIIDDIDLISNSANREKFIDYVSSRFNIVIATCHSEIDVDIKSRLKKRQTAKEFLLLEISPFFSDRRKELVSKLVSHIIKDDEERKVRFISVLTEELSRQKRFYNWNPEFIVQFTKYYCTNIGELAYNDGSVFSKVFEANITLMIKQHVRKITVDKILVVLDKIAYWIYINRKYPLSSSDMNDLIDEYNRVYDSKIDVIELVNILLNAKVMKKVGDNGYVFYDRNYLAYFTAREIRRHCLESNDFSQFHHIMEYSFSGLNSDILLFVTYITDNINIISMIIEQAEKAVQDWHEFSLLNIDVPFLVKPITHSLPAIDATEVEYEEAARVEQEKMENRALMKSNDSSIFDEQDVELKLVHKIIRCISLMSIIARILPSFEYMMKKEHKDKCVNLIYQMPLKIFDTWVREVDSFADELITNIKEFHEWEYRKDKLKVKPLTDDKALLVLRWEVISMLLELMNLAMSNATRENTSDFIDRFSYEEQPSYRIERLMGLGKRGNIDKFIDEAISISSYNSESTIIKYMVQRIARNFVLRTHNMPHNKLDKINSKLFAGSSNKAGLIYEIQRNMNKK